MGGDWAGTGGERGVRPGLRWGMVVARKERRWWPWALGLVWLAMVMSVMMAVPWLGGARLPDGSGWRMSGWDWVRCWFHDRSMGEPGSEGFRADVGAWQRRRELEPGSGIAMRGYLDSLLTSGDASRAEWSNGLVLGRALVGHGGTNEGDVGRLLRVSLRVVDDPEAWREAGRWVDRMGHGDRALYLATAADHGDWEEVGRGLVGWEPADELGRWVAKVHGWMNAGEGLALGEAVVKRARAAGRQGEAGAMMLRVWLAGAVVLRDGRMAGAALDAMRDAGSARLLDYLREDSVRLAAATGAISGSRAAQGWPTAREWREVLPWTRWLRGHGQLLRARSELERAALEWDGRAQWLEVAGEAIREQDWDLLLALGGHLVDGTRRVGDWAGMGHALKAMGLEGRERWHESRREWELRARSAPPREGWMMRWCLLFDRLGKVSEAGPWLAVMEGDEGGRVEYWRMRAKVALACGDREGWLRAVTRAAQFSPGDTELAMDRALGGLVLGREPERILNDLEGGGVVLKGGGRGRLLTAWAEARAGLHSSAEPSFQDLEQVLKDPDDRALLGYAWFEMLLKGGRDDEAWRRYGMLEMGRLPAPLVQWAEKESALLARRVAKAKAAREAAEGWGARGKVAWEGKGER